MRKTLIHEIAEIYDRNIRKKNWMTKADIMAMAAAYERQREIDRKFYEIKFKNM